MYKQRTKRTQSIVFALLCCACMLLFIFDSAHITALIYNGIFFALKKIIPSLFPFLLLSDILISTGVLWSVSKKLAPFFIRLKLNPSIVIPMTLGLVCGFPIGAVCVKEFHEKGFLSKKEADCALALSNCASPAFVISAVGENMLGDASLGVFLWLCAVLVSFSMSLLFMPKYKEKEHTFNMAEGDDFDFASAFVRSAKKSAMSMLNIGVLISFFYMLCSLCVSFLEKIDFSPITAAVVCCVLELGNGCYLASSLGTLASCICAFAVGFGGFCVFFQVKAAAHENSDMRIYLTIKLLCGLISALFAFFLL
ncbi:MAG: nucleoside recognition domain-containing protein [Clostridia bacterium]|nr:nucleoside recognition domain-containing protein [Clostridia bacterium]